MKTRSARPTLSLLATVLLLLLALALCVGCGDGAGSTSPQTAAPQTGSSQVSVSETGSSQVSSSETISPDQPITRDDPSGIVAGLVFQEPLPLDEARALGVELKGDLVALYRTDYAYVNGISTGPPVLEPELEPSRFTYVDAGQIRARRLAAESAGLSPPISGMHISVSYWEHWEDQWEQAQKPGVLFEAMALYVREAWLDPLRSDERFRGVEIIEHRRTDSLSPDYPGELLLEWEGFPEGHLSTPETTGAGG